MSKRAQERRQQKRNRKPQRPGTGTVPWLWILIVVIGLVAIGGVGYLLTTMPARTAANGQIPPTLSPELATAVGETADPTTTMNDATGENATTLLGQNADVSVIPAGPADYCRRHPRFARTLGFNERSILTTSAPTIKGLVMIQPAEGNEPERIYQDPTWDDAGYLGHMTFDAVGNVFLFPAPRVSLVDNPPAQQNTLYRADTDSAVMSSWLTLTVDAPLTPENPFGLMGTTYDCDTTSLYAATVAGSSAGAEIGKIVRIDVESAAVLAELQGIDPFGLTIYNELSAGESSTVADGVSATTKRLYFGAARAPEVYSVPLDENGDFAGQPQLELALPDPSLKAWRIVWDLNGDLIVRAMPFDFNLIATSERIEIPFRFRRDENRLWQYIAE